CLLFFAAAKKSRCRPAQGRRLKHEGNTRMPAKTQANQPTSQDKKNAQPYPKSQASHTYKSKNKSKSKTKNEQRKNQFPM
ncbi:hypothetical protein SB861_51505, partial [Paraburkholderia sp. SIMBA_049]